MAKIQYYPENHARLPCCPNFSQFALSNDSNVEKALDIVLKARKRTLSKEQKKRMIENIQNFAGDKKIGALRQLEDQQWKNLKVPMMVRVFLKHLINQSVSLTSLQLLECDFNAGKPLDWKSYEEGVASCLNMGFQKNQSLEALVIARGDIAAAIEYLLFSDPARKAEERERSRKTINRFVPPTKHHTVLAAEDKAKREMNKYDHMTGRELRQEIARMKNTLAQTKARNKEMELEQSNKAKEHQMLLYQECLKGLLCDNTISAGELQFLQSYQQKREISKEQHSQVLDNLGYT
eukprot:UN27199